MSDETIQLPSGGFVYKCQHCSGRCENRTLDICSECFRNQGARVLSAEEIGRPWTAVEAERAGKVYIKEWNAAHGSLAREAVDEKWKAIFLKNDPEGTYAPYDGSGVCDTSSKAQDNRDNEAQKLDKYSDQVDRPRNVTMEAKGAFPGEPPTANPRPLLSLDAYKLRKKLAVDTTRAQMELVVSKLLEDIRADLVEGFVLAVDMKEGNARVEAGGQMSCASALWLGQMIINKVGPN